MSQTITLPNSTYEWLQAEAKARGLESIEALIETWRVGGDEVRRRHEVVAQIKALSEQIAATHGEQSDSVDLIREDRDR